MMTKKDDRIGPCQMTELVVLLNFGHLNNPLKKLPKILILSALKNPLKDENQF